MNQQPFKIAIIANKTWECEPLVNLLLNKDARSIELKGFVRGYDPLEIHKFNKEGEQLDPETDIPLPLPTEAGGIRMKGFLPIRPRLTFSICEGTGIAEIWCIEDWMRINRNSSSSYEKFTYALPRIAENLFNSIDQEHKPDFIIAFGTAGIPVSDTLNGCVTIGSRIYISNPWKGGSDDEINKQIDKFGPLLTKELEFNLNKPINSPNLSEDMFKDMNPEVRFSAESRFLKAPIHPTDTPRILAGHGFASLGTVNICNYDDYIWADEKTLHTFEKNIKQREIGSMETTHGLIRLTWVNTPFLFVSGLTDRVPMFNSEVTPRKYSQNFVAAHNTGITIAFLLPEIIRLHLSNKLLTNNKISIDKQQ